MRAINAAFIFYNKQLLRDLDGSGANPEYFQHKVVRSLLSHGANSAFGREYSLASIRSLADFQNRIPLFTYNDLEPYVQRELKGEKNVLWDRPIFWFAMSSGTSSSRSKFIPINWESLHKCHYKCMQTMLAHYVRLFPQSRLFKGQSLTLGGSRRIDRDVDTSYCFGDLSAFLLINKPLISRYFTTPSRDIALIPNFEEKVDTICDLIPSQDLVSFSGVPSWNLILMRKVLEKTGKENLHQLWPNMELFMHGGINFEPYRTQYKELFPNPDMHYMETYNASEGFFAFQTDLNDPGMQVMSYAGVFYEFIPLDKLEDALAHKFTAFDTLETVVKDKPYAMVISTNAGLWRYLIGDTVRFTSLYPHKIRIVGRTQLFINAFGEELMIENAERSLAEACAQSHAIVNEYTVAPVFMEGNSKGAHQWLIEFEHLPNNMEQFVQALDSALMSHNSDYTAKRIETATMNPPQVVVLKPKCFYHWLADNGKLGGQSKVPRLWNTRQFADSLLAINASL